MEVFGFTRFIHRDGMLGGDIGLMADMMNAAKGTDGDYVDEITVDDFFDSLIEALDNDKDVFEYKSDTYSHPLLGKVVSIISSSEYQTLTNHSLFSQWMVSTPSRAGCSG